jgi:hypothetical protein
VFDAWNQGFDPYAASSPSMFKWNPSRFYAQNLPAGGDAIGGPPMPGTISAGSFATQWLAPFLVLAVLLYALQKGALRGGVKLSASGGAGHG